MTSSVTSTPVNFPTGVRITRGTITLDTAYAGGTVISAAQFGAASVGQARTPDVVIPIARQGTLDFTNQGVVNYDPATSKIHVYGTAFTADQDTTGGISEEATETIGALLIDYVAFWFTPDAGVATTVVA